MTDIKTAGGLRKFLIETMEKVKDGTLEPSKAAAIAKLAHQINESLRTEMQAIELDGKTEYALNINALELVESDGSVSSGDNTW